MDAKAPSLRYPRRPPNPEKQKVRDALARWLIRPTDPELCEALRASMDDFELIFRLWQCIPRVPSEASSNPLT